MFRIKTDIRQFKCETEEKVEDLIRKWVIRPNDLIFDASTQGWAPIGEHPDFGPVFELVAKNTKKSDSGEFDQAQTSSTEALPKLGVLRKKVAAAAAATASMPIPQAPEGVEPVAAPDEVTVMTERTADLLGLDDDENILATQEMSALPKPQAPEGVEPVAPSDEPTQIFARAEDEAQQDQRPAAEAAEPSLSEPSEPQRLTRKDLPEELFLTNEIDSPFARGMLIDELGEVGDSLLKQRAASVQIDGGWDSFADDLRSTDEFEQVNGKSPRASNKIIIDQSYNDQGDEERQEVTLVTARKDVSPSAAQAPEEKVESAPASEPEEILDLPAPKKLKLPSPPKALTPPATVSAPEDEEEIEDLPAPKKPAVPRFEPLSDPDEVVASVAQAPSDAEQEDEEEDPSALRRTQEGDVLSSAPSVSSLFKSPLADLPTPTAADDDEVAPYGEDFGDDDARVDEVSSPKDSEASGAERSDAEDASVEEVGVDPYTDLSEVSDPFDTAALLGEDTDEHEPPPPRQRSKTGRRVVVQDRDFISKGYALDLPFPVGPSAEDAKYGVVRSRMNEQDKDILFPKPQPKKSGELYMRSYGERKDWSPFVGVALLIIFVLIVISLIVFLR